MRAPSRQSSGAGGGHDSASLAAGPSAAERGVPTQQRVRAWVKEAEQARLPERAAQVASNSRVAEAAARELERVCRRRPGGMDGAACIRAFEPASSAAIERVLASARSEAEQGGEGDGSDGGLHEGGSVEDESRLDNLQYNLWRATQRGKAPEKPAEGGLAMVRLMEGDDEGDSFQVVTPACIGAGEGEGDTGLPAHYQWTSCRGNVWASEKNELHFVPYINEEEEVNEKYFDLHSGISGEVCDARLREAAEYALGRIEREFGTGREQLEALASHLNAINHVTGEQDPQLVTMEWLSRHLRERENPGLRRTRFMRDALGSQRGQGDAAEAGGGAAAVVAGADGEGRTWNAFRGIFCRRCFTYGCALGHALPQPAPLTIENEAAAVMRPAREGDAAMLTAGAGEKGKTDEVGQQPDEQLEPVHTGQPLEILRKRYASLYNRVTDAINKKWLVSKITKRQSTLKAEPEALKGKSTSTSQEGPSGAALLEELPDAVLARMHCLVERGDYASMAAMLGDDVTAGQVQSVSNVRGIAWTTDEVAQSGSGGEGNGKASRPPKRRRITLGKNRGIQGKLTLIHSQAMRRMHGAQATEDNATTAVHAYTACRCEGNCSDAQCPCVRNKTFCENFCACPPSCLHRFRGCHCTKGQCRTRACGCYRLNRECVFGLCRCTDGCAGGGDSVEPACCNMSLQLGTHRRVLVGQSDVHGWGLFACDPIPRGAFIIEYKGEAMSQDEAERRGTLHDARRCTFLFEVNKDVCLDAKRRGNKAKFINHHADNNCHARVMNVRGDHRIAIFAATEIAAGDELFFAYGFHNSAAMVHELGLDGNERNERNDSSSDDSIASL